MAKFISAREAADLIPDGATLQFGIGGMPNVLGSMLADSDLKDLGMHTELCSDAYADVLGVDGAV